MFLKNYSALTKKALLLAATALPFALSAVPADAAINHSDASLITYTDFGQNLGRYATGNVNALLAHIRERDGGVIITYTGGQADYTMQHGMIDFSSQNDGGYGVAIGVNFYATVEHNGVHNNTYAGNFIGEANAVHYQGIEYRSSEGNIFLLKPSNDYKITRQSKIITDVAASVVYGSADGDYTGITNGTLANQLLYRSGSGTMGVSNYNGTYTSLTGAYAYITGGIISINSIGNYNSADGAFSSFSFLNYSASGINSSNPLPFATLAGDSGSPTWVWNENTQQYEYLNAVQSGNLTTMTQARGAAQWTAETMASFDKTAQIGSDNVVYVNGVTTQTDATYSDSTNGVSTTLWTGTVTDASGETLTTFVGVKSGTHTWLNLDAIKNNGNWYAYGAEFLNASSNGNGKDMSYADLFYTENLVFKANSATETQQIVLNADVDLGLGYVQFSKADGAETADFTVSSASGENFLFNSAGYVVDKGVKVHLQLTNPSEYMREWRKIGDGDLCIEGSGNNDALLNLGGNGTTCLERENGYAAYNVLANNGTTVVIKDIGQIQRDFTFGFRGGVLDMNGNSMTWNNDNAPEAEGFTIHALDEGAVIANRAAGTTVTLTWTQGGAQTWLGAFRDTENSALKFVYDGGEGASLTMHGIYTELRNKKSGVSVASGHLSLAGTNTVHGKGSATGRNANRYFSAQDWHYADMTSNIDIQSGASFTLDSHARLTGDVTVQDGGTFIMREGVKSRYEYIEGGQTLEDTNAIADFFGLKGNIALNGENANLKIEFSENVTSNLTYSGDLSGSGNVAVALGTDGAAITLGGNNTFSGTKTLTSGRLVAESAAALGDVSRNKWIIQEAGWITVKGDSALTSAELLGVVDSSSVGVLALTGDRTEQIDLSETHFGLILGAAEGCVVSYGAAGTTEELAAVTAEDGGNGSWTLGGGGGELVVNFLLTGNNDLVLGNRYGKGVVTLTNAANDFTGTISFVGGVTLNYTDAAALGNSKIDLSYTNRAALSISALGNIPAGADGVLLIDSWTNEALDLSDEGRRQLAVGTNADAVFDGKIAVAENAAYRFGGATGTLLLTQALAANGTNDLVLDAQTYSGGAIMLGQKAQITGTVSLMAFDSEKLDAEQAANASGDITLTFLAGNDDALASAAATDVHSGGIIDLNGTKQTLKNLSVENGGSVIDSAGAGTLVVNSETETTLAGTVSVSALEKTGSANLNVSGDGSVSAGTLALREGVVTATHANAFRNIGKISVGAGETGTLVATASETAVGALDVDAAGMLILSGSAPFSLTAKDNNVNGGTIELRAAQVNLGYNVTENTQTVGGTLKISGDAPETVTIHTTGTANNVGKTIEHLDVAAGHTAVLSEESWNTIWTIHNLSGAGDVEWNSTTTHWFSSRVILDGANEDFTGTFTMNRNRSGDYENSGKRIYGAFVELAHDDALRGAVLKLSETTTTQNNHIDRASLAVNTDNAHLKGLIGDAGTHLYAGASMPGTADDEGLTLVPAPASVRQATLTFSGDGEYIFAGTVAGGEDGNGVSLVMNGAGTQKFTGSSIAVNDVSALAGTLVLEPAAGGSLTVSGNVGVARGATLTLAGGFSLDEGKTFSVLGSADASALASANFTGTLALNGGTLIFSGSALQSGSAALALGGLTASEALAQQNIDITDTYAIDAGARYQLASGDWSNIVDAFGVSLSEDYLSAEISAETGGLFVTFTLADGYCVWKGTETQNTWTASVFGVAGETVPGADGVAVFNDRGTPTVNIEGAVAAGTLLIDTSQNYVFKAADEAGALTASALRQVSDAVTTIESGVTVTGTTTIEAGEIIVKSSGATLGEISGAGTLGIDWNGTGTLSRLNGVGALHVIRGQFDDNATATNAGTIRVDAGGQFWAKAADQTANFELSGSGWTDGSAPAATLRLGGGATVSGKVALTGDSSILVAESGETGTISGALDTGAHTLTKAGAGTLNLSGSVSAAVLAVNSDAGTLAFSGATGTVSELKGDGEFSVSGTGTLAIGDMSGFSGNVTKTGTGALSVETLSENASWTFIGAAFGDGINFNAYAGENATITLVGAKGSRASDSHSFFVGGSPEFAQNFVLKADADGRGFYTNDGASSSTTKFSGKITGDGKFVAAGQGSVSDTIMFFGDTSEFAGGFEIGGLRKLKFSDNGGRTAYAERSHILGTGGIANTGKLIFDFDGAYTVENTISGNGSIEKTGAGTLALTNAQVSGTVTVSGGVLDLTRNNLPAQNAGNSLTVSNGAVVKIANAGWGAGTNLGTNYNSNRIYLRDGGVLEITRAQNVGGSARRAFTVSGGTGVFRYSGAGTNVLEEYSSEGHVFRAEIADGATLRFDVVQADATLDVSKTIGGTSGTTGAVEKVGAGTLRLSGGNVYSGGTTVAEGALVADSAAALGLGPVKITNGQLKIANAVTLNQTQISIVLNSLNKLSETQNAQTAVNAAARASIVGETAPAVAALAETEAVATSDEDAGTSSLLGGTLAAGTKISLELSAEERDAIANLTAGSVIEYYLWEPSTVAVGENQFDADGGSFNFIGDGWSKDWKVSYKNGVLTVAVPEPAAFGLLAGTIALALACAARRRRKKS